MEKCCEPPGLRFVIILEKNTMKRIGIVLVMSVVASVSVAQISTGKVEEPKKEPVQPVKSPRVPTIGLDETVYFGGVSITQSFRKLEENVAPYGDPIGFRADETPLTKTGFQIGMRNRFHELATYEVGLSWDKYGEKYAFQATEDDSSFNYTNTYSYISLPIQAFLTYGKDLRVFIGGGIQPQLAMNHLYEENYSDSLGGNFSRTVRTADRMNGFSLHLLASAGVQWRFSKLFSLYAIPTYGYALTSTLGKQESYKHYVRAWNFRFGLTLHIPN